MKKILLWFISFYKKNISPNKPHCCRFYPTCSTYAYEAVSRYGVIKGSYLAVKRLLRCQPLCKGGFDPVPDNFGKKKGN